MLCPRVTERSRQRKWIIMHCSCAFLFAKLITYHQCSKGPTKMKVILGSHSAWFMIYADFFLLFDIYFLNMLEYGMKKQSFKIQITLECLRPENNGF